MKKICKCILLAVLVGQFAWGMTAANTAKAPGEMVIPFELKGHIIVVKCRINDAEQAYDFIVDTGGLTFIDKALADGLKLKQKGPMAKINTLLIGDHAVENVFVFTTFDFKQFKTAYGITISGIIGSNFLESYMVTIDYDDRRMILSSDTESLAAEKEKNGAGYFLKFTNHMINNSPMIKCRLNGAIEVEGMIDTGQPFPLVLPLNFLEKTGALKQTDILKAKGVMVKWPNTKSTDNYLSRLPSFEAGGLKMESMITLYAELPPMLSVPLLGKDFLAHFLIKINYPKDEIFLLPKPESQGKGNLFSAGLSLAEAAGNNIVVRGVWENSPADKAGIQVGDQILEFSSKELTSASLSELSRLIQDEKITSVELVVKNSAGQRKILLKKENLFR